MKNVAIIAVLLGVIGSTANAESAVSEAPLTLALNSSSAAVTWVEPATAINTEALADDIELEVSKAMEKVSVELGEQLEAKIAKELEYAMH